MLKELQEDVEKVKKIMCERNGNMNKETGNLKGNSGAEKYNNWSENFTRGLQRQTLAGRKKKQWTWNRTMKIIKSEEQKEKTEEKWTV